jgi:hypothetical protein
MYFVKKIICFLHEENSKKSFSLTFSMYFFKQNNMFFLRRKVKETFFFDFFYVFCQKQ